MAQKEKKIRFIEEQRLQTMRSLMDRLNHRQIELILAFVPDECSVSVLKPLW